MPRFTNTEKTDMVLIYGECHGNSRDALSVYAKRYPNRPKPSRETFRKLVANLRSDGAFQKLVRKPRSNRFAGDERIEERALALVHQNPHTSSRAVAEEVGCSHQTILTIWHKYKFHFSVERFINDPELINFYTGFKDYTTFKAVFKALEPTAEKMLRWGQVQKANKAEKKDHAPKHERVSLIDQFFMFLIRIRRGWTFKDLAIHFKVSTTTINGMIVTWTNYLFFMLGAIPLWISKEANQKNMPEVFKKTALCNTRVIIYIHDLKIRKAVAKKNTVDMYSMEKEYSNFKGLVALSPCGVLVFVSSLYPGNMTDREVTIRSGILDMLEPLDEVMLEKDFPIADLLANRRVKLNYPPFIQQYSQHYPTHEKETPEMTLLKAYIHKINQHIKEYQVFDNELNLHLAGTLNQLWAVCCILTNFHGLETCS